MRPLSFFLVFSILIFPGMVYASQVTAGDKSVEIVDSFARVEDWFGKPGLEVYFFARPLTDEQKGAIAAKRYPSRADIERISPGNPPLLELNFFFKEETIECSPDNFLSYTAVFRKSNDLLSDSVWESPINWSFSRPKEMSKVGVSKLECSFAQGSTVDVRVKNQWLADGEYLKKLYTDGRAPVLFTWDVDVKTNVIGSSR